MDIIRRNKNFLAIILTSAVQIFGALFSLSIISMLDIKFFAIYALILTILDISNSTILFGNEKYFQKNLLKKDKINKYFINTSFSLNIVLSLGLFFIISFFYSRVGNNQSILYIILLSPMLLNFRNFIVLIYRFTRNNIFLLKVKSLIVSLGLILKYIIYIQNFDLIYLVIIIISEQLLEVFFLIILANNEKKYFPDSFIFSFNELKKLFKRLIPIGFSILLFTILIRIEILYINYFLSSLNVAAFFLCVKLFNAMLIFTRSVTQLKFPLLIQAKKDKIMSEFNSFYLLLIASGVFSSIFLYIFGFFYITYFINSDLAFTTDYLPFFSIAIFFHSLSSIRNSYLISIRKEKDIFLPQLISFLSKLIVSYYAILNFGLIGACLSFVVIELMNFSIFNLFLKSTRKLLMFQLFINKNL